MANNREISRLDEMAFEALLRYGMEITPNSEAEYDVLMRHKLKTEFNEALKHAAYGRLDDLKEIDLTPKKRTLN